MIKVIVFDDNNSRRKGLELLIDSMGDMTCVGIFSNCDNVVKNLRTLDVDVVLMDINMPIVNGIEGVKLIKQHYPKVKIIMQTIFEDDNKILEAITSGADGYIMKQKSPLSLIEGVRDVLDGGSPITPSVASKILKLFVTRSAITEAKTFNLTNREIEVLKLLVSGLSYKMIADKCHISYATVNTHVSHIYKKLQVNSVASAVSKAIKEGLV